MCICIYVYMCIYIYLFVIYLLGCHLQVRGGAVRAVFASAAGACRVGVGMLVAVLLLLLYVLYVVAVLLLMHAYVVVLPSITSVT